MQVNASVLELVVLFGVMFICAYGFGRIKSCMNILAFLVLMYAIVVFKEQENWVDWKNPLFYFMSDSRIVYSYVEQWIVLRAE